MAVAEAFVRSKLAPYEVRIREIIKGAWSDYLSIGVRHKFLFPRTRANIVFDLIAGRAIIEFEGDKKARVIRKDETVKILVEDALIVRIKKANEDGLGSNILTQSVLAFVAQEPELPGLLSDLCKIEICYFESATGAGVDAIMVTARDNDTLLWSYELGHGESAEIIPFPTENADDAPPEIEPRKDSEDKTEDEEG
jgi:hypothetical protein